MMSAAVAENSGDIQHYYTFSIQPVSVKGAQNIRILLGIIWRKGEAMMYV